MPPTPHIGKAVAALEWGSLVDWLHVHCTKFYATDRGAAAVVFAAPKEHGDVAKLVRRALARHADTDAAPYCVSVTRHADEAEAVCSAHDVAQALRRIHGETATEHELVKTWHLEDLLRNAESEVFEKYCSKDMNADSAALWKASSVTRVKAGDTTVFLLSGPFQSRSYRFRSTRWEIYLRLHSWVKHVTVLGLPPDTEVQLTMNNRTVLVSKDGRLDMSDPAFQDYLAAQQNVTTNTISVPVLLEQMLFLGHAFGVSPRSVVNCNVLGPLHLQSVQWNAGTNKWDVISGQRVPAPFVELQVIAETLHVIQEPVPVHGASYYDILGARAIAKSGMVLYDNPPLPTGTVIPAFAYTP